MWKKRPSSWGNSKIGTLQMCVLDINQRLEIDPTKTR
jgi:hypothetical protein